MDFLQIWITFMLSKEALLRCKVCGFKQHDFPWGQDGETPSFDICACCGVEFGYEDATLISVKKYRSNWIEGGSKWFSIKDRPLNWNKDNQFKYIPDEFK